MRGTLCAALAVLELSACGGSADFVFLTERRFPARPESHPVEVVDGSPARPSVRIGSATAHPFVGSTEQTCLDAVKESARQVGGDALLNWHSEVGAPGTVGQGLWTCRADMIRWTDG